MGLQERAERRIGLEAAVGVERRERGGNLLILDSAFHDLHHLIDIVPAIGRRLQRSEIACQRLVLLDRQEPLLPEEQDEMLDQPLAYRGNILLAQRL